MDKKESIRQRLASLKLAIQWTYESSKPLTILIFVLSIVAGLLTIVEPYIFKLIIDSLTQTSQLGSAQKFGIGIAGILVVYAIARILQNIFVDVQALIKRTHGLRLERYAARKVMERVSSLDVVYFENPEYYNTLSRANANLYRLLDLFWQLTFFISGIVSIIVIVAALAVYNWAIVVVILLSAIPGVILALRSSEFVWSAFMESSPISRHAQYYKTMMTEQPEAIKEIRMFGLKDHFLSLYDGLFNSFLQKQDATVRTELKWFIVVAVIEAGFSVFAAWLVVRMFLHASITIGELTLLWALLFQFASQVRWTVRMTSDMYTHTAFLTTVVTLLAYEPLVKEIDTPIPFPKKITKGIEFRNVTFTYPGANKPTLKNVSLHIKQGESLAIVGENGSGKTTLIKLLCRLYDVTEGEILIDGRNIKEYSLEELYNNLGVIFQDFMKYEGLIKQNVGYGRLHSMHDTKRVHAASQQSGAWEFVKELDKKYDTHLGKRLNEQGTELSVGQWQKVALARAFFREAQVVILDEPTAAVDARAEYALFKRFRKLTKKRTTLLISHRFSTVRMADVIVVLHNGRLKEQGSHQDLLRKNGTYAKLFKLQAEGYQ